MRSLPDPDQDPFLRVNAEYITRRFFEEAERAEPAFRHSMGGAVWAATQAAFTALLSQHDVEPGAGLPLHVEPSAPRTELAGPPLSMWSPEPWELA